MYSGSTSDYPTVVTIRMFYRLEIESFTFRKELTEQRQRKRKHAYRTLAIVHDEWTMTTAISCACVRVHILVALNVCTPYVV